MKKGKKIICIESDFNHSFDLYQLEVITKRGSEMLHVLYLTRDSAEGMAAFYRNNGLERDGFVWRVYEVNIINCICSC